MPRDVFKELYAELDILDAKLYEEQHAPVYHILGVSQQDNYSKIAVYDAAKLLYNFQQGKPINISSLIRLVEPKEVVDMLEAKQLGLIETTSALKEALCYISKNVIALDRDKLTIPVRAFTIHNQLVGYESIDINTMKKYSTVGGKDISKPHTITVNALLSDSLICALTSYISYCNAFDIDSDILDRSTKNQIDLLFTQSTRETLIKLGKIQKLELISINKNTQQEVLASSGYENIDDAAKEMFFGPDSAELYTNKNKYSTTLKAILVFGDRGSLKKDAQGRTIQAPCRIGFLANNIQSGDFVICPSSHTSEELNKLNITNATVYTDNSKKSQTILRIRKGVSLPEVQIGTKVSADNWGLKSRWNIPEVTNSENLLRYWTNRIIV